jgi:hypothetical protein
VLSGKTVSRVVRTWSSLLEKRRMASLTYIIFCQQSLELLRELARRRKEEV